MKQSKLIVGTPFLMKNQLTKSNLSNRHGRCCGVSVDDSIAFALVHFLFKFLSEFNLQFQQMRSGNSYFG
jgi:hypothetical protein